ncbi:exo-alpha-sialidase [Gorillibacterium sp. CAU 1737]|uniref:exo-alpha-sialidase n=1 Tax=Gorillibacterium sp. CAU 1737 TaxID=3140362 RepID=UPI003261A081
MTRTSVSARMLSLFLCILLVVPLMAVPAHAEAELMSVSPKNNEIQDTTAQPNTAQQVKQKSVDTVFPVAFQRATKDEILSVATNGKGTIMTTSSKYLNITANNGKTWEARKLPPNGKGSIETYQNLYFLRHLSDYVSKDGKTWTTLVFKGPNDEPLSMAGVDYLNGKLVLQAIGGKAREEKKNYLFTSTDGKTWDYQGVLQLGYRVQLFWNGKRYTAVGGGYKLAGNPKLPNQFSVGNGDTGEMVVLSSPDLTQWTQHSGSIRSDVSYTFYVQGGPSRNYFLTPEWAPSGQIAFFDPYGHLLVSTDGKTFTSKKEPTILHSTDGRTPMMKKGDQYYVFQMYWIRSGVVGTKLLTSKDRVNWKSTVVSTSKTIWAIPSGNQFLSVENPTFTDGKLMLSDDGVHWRQIK